MTIPNNIQDIAAPAALVISATAMITQAVPLMPDGAWAQYGLLGVVLGWFMYRSEKRMEQIVKELRTLSQAMLLTAADDPTERAALKERLRREIADKISE